MLPSLKLCLTKGCKNSNSFRNLEHLLLFDCRLVTIKKGLVTILYGLRNNENIIGNIIDWNDNAVWIKINWQFNFILWPLENNAGVDGRSYGE